VHFFWGSFDLAVTRFSGPLRARESECGSITREGYSHEGEQLRILARRPQVSSRGRFILTLRPPRKELLQHRFIPEAGNAERGYFVLKYDDVRESESPEPRFSISARTTYEAAANLAHWDRASLER
jgi:hypothetical protein